MKNFITWLENMSGMTGITALIYFAITGLVAANKGTMWFSTIIQGTSMFILVWGAIALIVTSWSFYDSKDEIETWFKAWRARQHKLSELKAKAALPPPPDTFDLAALREVESISPKETR